MSTVEFRAVSFDLCQLCLFYTRLRFSFKIQSKKGEKVNLRQKKVFKEKRKFFFLFPPNKIWSKTQQFLEFKKFKKIFLDFLSFLIFF